ncbi:MAG: hypothetical protein SGBAC_001934 [Bacillariaceae sp.]
MRDHSMAYEALLQMELFASAAFKDFSEGDGKYRILCTTPGRQMRWGSYQIRCRDLKHWTDRCVPDARIYLLSHEQVNDFFRLFDRMHYNATVSIKTPFNNPSVKFGKNLLDVVDNYDVRAANVNENIEIIVQNHHHADGMFKNRVYHVVEHWYNSYPEDMMSSKTVFEVPQITSVETLKMATVWTNKYQPCPDLYPMPPDVEYDCIDEVYNIEVWYENYFNDTTPEEDQRLRDILEDPSQGPGRLYYELFWRYDVLVIPVKTAFMPKLKYGNVQRAVSQMRSGAPVLLEIYGEVLEEFMFIYNYSCAFVLNKTELVYNTTRQYWSFSEATEAIRSPELRRKCQEEGFAIVKDYSPSAIAKKQLRALGFTGGFNCT